MSGLFFDEENRREADLEETFRACSFRSEEDETKLVSDRWNREDRAGDPKV